MEILISAQYLDQESIGNKLRAQRLRAAVEHEGNQRYLDFRRSYHQFFYEALSISGGKELPHLNCHKRFLTRCNLYEGHLGALHRCGRDPFYCSF